jgi:hypothetical protein
MDSVWPKELRACDTHCSDMEHCSDWRDWNVLPTGHGTGTVGCGDLRGWFTRNSHGHIQIEWTSAPEGGLPPDVLRAATEACEKADGGQRTSKAGRIDAGG